VIAAACLVAAVCTPHPVALASPTTPVYVFPIPNARFVAPRTQVVFRGLNIGQLGVIRVTGSRTGVHHGRVLGDSDNAGGSFLPDLPFSPGERVTVATALNIVGGSGGSFSFRIAFPARGNRESPFKRARRDPDDVRHFHSRPDLAPAAVRVLRRSARANRGYIFVAPHTGPLQDGPMILDSKGRLVWFKAFRRKHFVSDFRVQRLYGKPVLTWWEGVIRLGTGDGADVIYDQSYHEVGAVHAANGLTTDFHEFQLTSRGTALITSYFSVFDDARSVYGSRHQDVAEGIVQEIDIPTGLVLFEWDSLDHVPLKGSYGPLKAPYNYFHLNSVDEDLDGNLIISGRNTWSAYKVNRLTAKTMWILGGTHSSFKMRPGTRFAYQHDVRVRSRGDRIVTVFDDGGSPFVHHSRALTLRLDFRHRRVSRVREDDHRPTLWSQFEGNVQQLPRGHLFVGWGQQPYFSEFDGNGRMIFDARFVDANITYRAWRLPWRGTPASLVAVAAHKRGRRATIWVSWNGATNVSFWRVLGGRSANSLTPIRVVRKRGFETAIKTRSRPWVAIEALDRAGRAIGLSAAVRVR
jgi:Arylsulfotransferase (ASST)